MNALGQTDVDETLAQFHLTVFVPTNAAFVHLFDDIGFDSIDDFSDNTLQDLLFMHIHQGDFISMEDLEDRCGDRLFMANGDSTRTVCENNANIIYQKGPRNSPDDMPRINNDIVAYDILACNGSIIHAVNEVMLPRYVQYCE